MKNWEKQEYQSLKKTDIKNLSSEDFHSLALKQKEFFPDMLEFCEEEEILRIFYESYQRKFTK